MKYLKSLLLGCLLVALTGCSYSSMIRGEVASRGAAAEDQLLESAEWARCNGVSVGSVRREYDTQEKLDAYLKSCERFFN